MEGDFSIERPLNAYREEFGYARIEGTMKSHEHFSMLTGLLVAFCIVSVTAFSLRLVEETALQPTYAAPEELLQINQGLHVVWEHTQTGLKEFFIGSPVYAAEKSTASQSYSAVLLLKSHQTVSLPAKSTIELRYGFKNTGKSSWKNGKVVRRNIYAAEGDTISGPEVVSSRIEGGTEIKKGQIGFVVVNLQAPEAPGTFNTEFQLLIEEVPVEGGVVEIPVTVTEILPSEAIAMPSASEAPLPDPPIIRVGIAKIEGTNIQAVGEYDLLDGTGAVYGTLESGQSVQITFDRATGLYYLDSPVFVGSASSFIRLVPKTDDGYGIIFSLIDRPSWNPSVNYNAFRGILEVRYSEKNDKVWIINELPIELYLRGLKESSNISPMEFQKALMIAARSYALYHLNNGNKHKDRYFHVDAKYDQVYKGYIAEQQSPKVTQAILETEGIVVTYEGDPVITPYFTRSDGRTRDWTEVWGGKKKPWLVSVRTEFDAGKKMLGHGVGMSAQDALYRTNRGATWKELLRYYYPGTDIEKVYR